jgi:hypothetical protein
MHYNSSETKTTIISGDQACDGMLSSTSAAATAAWYLLLCD